MNNNSIVKAAFVGFGEVNTPKEILISKHQNASNELIKLGLNIADCGLVTDDPDGNEVNEAIQKLYDVKFHSLIICIAGWIPSHTVIQIVEQFKHIPMVLWSLSGYSDGSKYITTADAAGSTALRSTFERMGLKYRYIVNFLEQHSKAQEVVNFCIASDAINSLKGARIGSMGYRDMRLFATMHEGVSLRNITGIDVECFEMLEMAQNIETINKEKLHEIVQWMQTNWKFQKTPQIKTLEQTASLYLAIKSKIAARNYQSISLIDVDGVKKLMQFAPAGVFMLIDAFEKIPTIPENDIMGAATQLIINKLTGQIGAYLEFYEFKDNGALMGVPDYISQEITDGETLIMPTAFGSFGEGLLNVSKIKTGAVTLARLAYDGMQYFMHVAVAEAKEPPQWEEAGWTPPAPRLPALFIEFEKSIHEFLNHVQGQHYIIAYGNQISLLENYCNLSHIKLVI
ncbi:MAG: hypothetical protein NW207_07825 [Cytophagales bacterium]|nr:hypothetical protein [Cytophagales bacterium]